MVLPWIPVLSAGPFLLIVSIYMPLRFVTAGPPVRFCDKSDVKVAPVRPRYGCRMLLKRQ